MRVFRHAHQPTAVVMLGNVEYNNIYGPRSVCIYEL